MKKIMILLLIYAVLAPISLAAKKPRSQPAKHAIYTELAPAPIGPFSQAIQAGNMIYISGQIPTDLKTGELVKGNFLDQFKRAVNNLSEIAKASGGSLDNIVKLTIYVTDLGNFSAINEVMKEYFHKPYPARSVIEIKSLPKNAPVEIEAIMEKKKS